MIQPTIFASPGVAKNSLLFWADRYLVFPKGGNIIFQDALASEFGNASFCSQMIALHTSSETITCIHIAGDFLMLGCASGLVELYEIKCEFFDVHLEPCFRESFSDKISSLAFCITETVIVAAISTVLSSHIVISSMTISAEHGTTEYTERNLRLGSVAETFNLQTFGVRQTESSCVIPRADGVMILFGTVQGRVHVYKYSTTLSELLSSYVTISGGFEAHCSVTSLRAYAFDENLCIFVTSLYSAPQVFVLTHSGTGAYVLQLCASLTLHHGQMLSSDIIRSASAPNTVFLITTGTDRMLYIYAHTGCQKPNMSTDDASLSTYGATTLVAKVGNDENSFARGYISISNAVLPSGCVILAGMVCDGCLIAFKSLVPLADVGSAAREPSVPFSRFNIPYTVSESVSSITLFDRETSLVTSSSQMCSVLHVGIIPLAFGIIHGCTIYTVLDMGDLCFGVGGDESELRVFTLPQWAREFVGWTSVSRDYTIPLGGTANMLSLTVTPLWNATDLRQRGIAPPCIGFQKNELQRRYSEMLTEHTKPNTDTGERLVRGLSLFPEIFVSCNFPGSNCVSLSKSVEANLVISCSIAGRSDEDSITLWSLHRQDFDKCPRIGSQFSATRLCACTPYKGRSFVAAHILEVQRVLHRDVATSSIPVIIASVTENGMLLFLRFNRQDHIKKLAIIRGIRLPGYDELFTMSEYFSPGKKPCLSVIQSEVLASAQAARRALLLALVIDYETQVACEALRDVIIKHVFELGSSLPEAEHISYVQLCHIGGISVIGTSTGYVFLVRERLCPSKVVVLEKDEHVIRMSTTVSVIELLVSADGGEVDVHVGDLNGVLAQFTVDT